MTPNPHPLDNFLKIPLFWESGASLISYNCHEIPSLNGLGLRSLLLSYKATSTFCEVAQHLHLSPHCIEMQLWIQWFAGGTGVLTYFKVNGTTFPNSKLNLKFFLSLRVPKTLVARWHCHLESFCASGKFLREFTKLPIKCSLNINWTEEKQVWKVFRLSGKFQDCLGSF